MKIAGVLAPPLLGCWDRMTGHELYVPSSRQIEKYDERQPIVVAEQPQINRVDLKHFHAISLFPINPTAARVRC
jgi:hypothetical protein